MKQKMLLLGLLVFILGSGFAFSAGKEIHRDPAKVIIWLLDFRLDLSEAQEQEMKKILDPAVAEFRAERKKALVAPEEMLKKFGDGQLVKADLLQIMERRRKFAETHQEKVAETVIKVYQVLTPSQRQTAVAFMQSHLDRIKQ
jgi:Spy/CpxP family protein refolding chaperone